MFTHTPGPWEVKVDGSSIMAKDSDSDVGFAACGNKGTPAQKLRQQANARLIAGAPELLRSLQFLIAAAQTEPGMAIYKAHITKAQLVIAKATGKGAS